MGPERRGCRFEGPKKQPWEIGRSFLVVPILGFTTIGPGSGPGEAGAGKFESPKNQPGEVGRSFVVVPILGSTKIGPGKARRGGGVGSRAQNQPWEEPCATFVHRNHRHPSNCKEK